MFSDHWKRVLPHRISIDNWLFTHLVYINFALLLLFRSLHEIDRWRVCHLKIVLKIKSSSCRVSTILSHFTDLFHWFLFQKASARWDLLARRRRSWVSRGQLSSGLRSWARNAWTQTVQIGNTRSTETTARRTTTPHTPTTINVQRP